MYELRNKPSVLGLKRGTFSVAKLGFYVAHEVIEGPKLVTLARHTNLSDVTPIHCKLKFGGVADFRVPKQNFLLHYSPGGFKFTTTRVFFGSVAFWLVICEETRQGFLLPGQTLNAQGSLSRSKRLRPGRLYH